MIIRELTIEDYEKLAPFWKKNYFLREMDSKENLQVFLEKNPKLSILAEKDGNIIGTVLGSFDGRRGYLQKLVVDKSFRKKGLGKQLAETVIKKLKHLGVRYIPLSVEPELVHFYTTCGFKQTSQIPMNMEI